mgnify:CR=1 FL=1
MNGACVRLEQLAKRGKAAEVPLATHEYLESDPAPEMRKRVLRAESEAIRMLGNEELANALADRVAGHRPAAAAAPAGRRGRRPRAHSMSRRMRSARSSSTS